MPALDDRLVSAVAVVVGARSGPRCRRSRGRCSPTPRARADAVDLDAVVPGEALRRAGFQAAAALLVLAAVAFVGRDEAREAWTRRRSRCFPSHVTPAT